MHLKARPSSSAWTLPAGVSSPPHFKTSKRDGSSLRTSDIHTPCTRAHHAHTHTHTHAHHARTPHTHTTHTHTPCTHTTQTHAHTYATHTTHIPHTYTHQAHAHTHTHTTPHTHTHTHIKYSRLGCSNHQQFISHLIFHIPKEKNSILLRLKALPSTRPTFNAHFLYLFQICGVNEQSLNVTRGVFCDLLSEWFLQENPAMWIRLILFAQDCTKISSFYLLLLYFIIHIVENCLWLHSTLLTYNTQHMHDTKKTCKIQKKKSHLLLQSLFHYLMLLLKCN